MIDKVERKIGRMYYDIEWIPAVRVIRVDRSLVTREWTDSPNTGSSASKGRGHRRGHEGLGSIARRPHGDGVHR